MKIKVRYLKPSKQELKNLDKCDSCGGSGERCYQGAAAPEICRECGGTGKAKRRRKKVPWRNPYRALHAILVPMGKGQWYFDVDFNTRGLEISSWGSGGFPGFPEDTSATLLGDEDHILVEVLFIPDNKEEAQNRVFDVMQKSTYRGILITDKKFDRYWDAWEKLPKRRR